MKKNLILLISALLLLGGILFISKTMQKNSSQSQLVFSESLLKDLKSIYVYSQLDTAKITQVGSQWTLQVDSFPVDTQKINEALRLLKSFEERETVSKSPDRAKEYGLDSTSARYIDLIGTDGKVLGSVAIGRTSSMDYNSTYWKRLSDPTIYRTPGNLGYLFSHRKDDWRNKTLASFKTSDITGIDIHWVDSSSKASEYSIKDKGNNQWELVKNSQGQLGIIKSDQATTLTSKLQDLMVDEFVAKGAEVTIPDTSSLNITVSLKQGSSQVIKAQQQNGFFYLKHPKFPLQVKLAEWRLNSFQVNPNSWIDSTAMNQIKDSSQVQTQPK